MSWTLVFLYVATVNPNGYPTLGGPSQYVSTSILTFASRAEAETELVKRAKAQAESLPLQFNAIPAVIGSYTTTRWAGAALLVSPTGKVENVRAIMGKRKVVKEVEVEEETGWKVEVLP